MHRPVVNEDDINTVIALARCFLDEHQIGDKKMSDSVSTNVEVLNRVREAWYCLEDGQDYLLVLMEGHNEDA